MWIDCSSGMIQLTDWIASLSERGLQRRRELARKLHRSAQLAGAGSLPWPSGCCRPPPYRSAALHGVAMLARRRRRLLAGHLNSGPSAEAGRLAVAQRMQAHAEDRAAAESCSRRCRPAPTAPSRPSPRPTRCGLPSVSRSHVLALLVHRREEDLQMVRVRIHARDDAGEDLRLLHVVGGERMMRLQRHGDDQAHGGRDRTALRGTIVSLFTCSSARCSSRN